MTDTNTVPTIDGQLSSLSEALVRTRSKLKDWTNQVMKQLDDTDSSMLERVAGQQSKTCFYVFHIGLKVVLIGSRM